MSRRSGIEDQTSLKEDVDVVTAKELAELLQEAIADKTAEPTFFRALLDASVYVHVPRIVHRDRVSFVQFTTPEGLTVLPFFSDDEQAKAASGPSVAVAMLTGRQLFSMTRGATLMLNPNQTSCVLYPEEISSLLDQGDVPVVERIDTGDQTLLVGPANSSAAPLIERLIEMYARFNSIERAYVCEVRSANESEGPRFLIAAAVPAVDAEHAARATATEIHRHFEALETTVDFTAFDPASPPNWIIESGLEPFFIRDVGSHGTSSSSLH